MIDFPTEIVILIMQASYPLDAMRLKYTCKHLSRLTPVYTGDKYEVGDVFRIPCNLSVGDSMCLSKYGHLELIRRSKFPSSCLDGGCNGGHIDIVRWSIGQGVENFNGGFVCACSYGHLDIAKMLFAFGRVDLRHGFSIACSSGEKNIVEWLIENVKMSGFYTRWDKFMHLSDGLNNACYGGHKDIIELLIRSDVNYYQPGLNGACRGGHKDIAKWMIDLGARDFNEGLIHACRNNQLDLASLMVEYGANDFTKAMEYAEQCGSYKIVKWLAERNVDL